MSRTPVPPCSGKRKAESGKRKAESGKRKARPLNGERERAGRPVKPIHRGQRAELVGLIVQIRRFLMLTNTRMLVAMGLLAGRKSVAAIQRGLAIDGKYGRNLGRTLGLSERESGAPSPSRPP